MAAYNLHRKIFEDETEICKFQCDPLKNPYFANCLPVCFSTCPDYCIPSESFPPSYPLPPPPPADGSFNTGGPPQHHHSSLSLPLKISLVVLVLTFSFFLLYTLYKFYTVWYRSRRRPRRGSNTGPGPASENQETHDEFLDHDVLDHPIWYIRTIGLQPSVISAITIVKYNKTDGMIEGTDCSVCLSEFQDDETLRLLPKCNHAFHISCIDTWLRSHTNCPLCRAGIVSIAATAANSDDMGRRAEEGETAISITEGEQTRQVDQDGNESNGLTIGVVNEENKGDNIVGGSGTIRRSVSLNDYAACRIRSDILNNNYYSDRHDVQIQSIDASLGFDLVKVDQTANNQVGLND